MNVAHTINELVLNYWSVITIGGNLNCRIKWMPSITVTVY